MENDSGLELIRTSLTGNVRREMLNGREYLVAPVTMIVPGVLHGNKGPMLYPHEQVVLNPGDWNHMPIVLRHPLDESGIETSARTPSILEASQLGLVFSAEAEDKLGAEAWFDVLKTKKLSPQTLRAVEQGKKIEVSTGLFTDHFEAEQGATFNGTEYSFIAKNYRPDHLAVLVDEKGACSIKDGCGINVNGNPESNLWKTVISWLVGNRIDLNCGGEGSGVPGPCPGGGGGSGGSGDSEGSKGAESKTTGPEKSAVSSAVSKADKASKKASSGLKSEQKEANENANKASKEALKSDTPEAHDKARDAHKAAARIHKQLEDKADRGGTQGSTSVRDHYMARAAHEEAARAHSDRKESLTKNSSFEECTEANPCYKCKDLSQETNEVLAVNEDFITRIKLHQQIVLPGTDRWIEDARDGLVIYRQQGKTYKQMYQVREDGELELLENPTEVTRIASYFRKTRGAEDMAKKLTDNERKGMSDFIVANCSPFKDKGKEILAKLTDEQLTAVKTNAEMIQKIRSLKTNAEGDGVVEGVAIADLAEFLGVTVDPANDPVGFVKALTDALDAVRAQLGTPAPEAPVEDPPVDEAVTMSEGDEEEKRKKMATNRGKVKQREKTLQEWMADAPAPVRSAVTNAMKVEKAEKVKIIKRLVANLSDDKKVARIKKLQEKSLEELQDIAEMIPEANSGNRTQEQEEDDLLADYSIGQGPTTHGAGGAGKGEEDEDFLALPAMTYNRKVGKNRKAEQTA